MEQGFEASGSDKSPARFLWRLQKIKFLPSFLYEEISYRFLYFLGPATLAALQFPAPPSLGAVHWLLLLLLRGPAPAKSTCPSPCPCFAFWFVFLFSVTFHHWTTLFPLQPSSSA